MLILCFQHSSIYHFHIDQSIQSFDVEVGRDLKQCLAWDLEANLKIDVLGIIDNFHCHILCNPRCLPSSCDTLMSFGHLVQRKCRLFEHLAQLSQEPSCVGI